MNIKKIVRKSLNYGIVAALSSVATYCLCTLSSNDEIATLKEKIAELEVKERNAIVTQRISEQMEDLANQEKLVSDAQRLWAEEQSRIADMERGKAEIERATAREAERKAVVSARQADSIRVVAVAESERATMHMKEAQQAQAKVDTLLYNFLSRSLAQNSRQQMATGNTQLASLLAYSAWHFAKEYNNNIYQQDIYTSLVSTSGTNNAVAQGLKGSVRGIAMTSDTKADTYMAVTDYGEIIRLPRTRVMISSADETDRDIIFSNKAYDFRDVMMTSLTTALALDINGSIITTDLYATVPCRKAAVKLPQDKWKHIVITADSTVAAIGEHTIALLSADASQLISTTTVDGTITAAGTNVSDGLRLFLADGRMLAYDGKIKEVMHYPFAEKDNITAFVHHKDYNYYVMGATSGNLYICNPDGTLVQTLHGHTGGVTTLREEGRIVISASYDHSVRIWDMLNLFTLTVTNNVSYQQWPLCFIYDKDYATARIGFADGTIRALCISTTRNAAATKAKLEREFTPQEWDYYIGKDVPHVNFMNK